MNKYIDKDIDYKVTGYTNNWRLIDTYGKYGLLENCFWGDDTCYLIVDLTKQPKLLPYKRKDGQTVKLVTITSIVCETYDDIITTLKDENLID